MHARQKEIEVPGCKFVHHLPFGVFRKLGILLDCNNDWRILGGEYMNFDHYELERFSRAFLRRESPTEEMILAWGNKNGRISKLFCFLAEMKHYKALKELMPYVDKKYYRLYPEGVSQMVSDSITVPPEPPTNNEKLDSGSSQCDEKPKQNGAMAAPNDQNSQRATVEKTDTIDYKELGSGLPTIDYSVLQESTNQWHKSNVLGQGGFGVVFMGVVKQTRMAIKHLKRQGNEMAFDALQAQLRDLFKELKYLDSNRHDNILPLYGYSYKEGNFCLVSQFMPNGSLEDRLLCRNKSLPLSARIRCYIANGIARGLQFLHDREKPLVHGDIKSANILLDRSFEPKIGDFGLSREGPTGNYSYVQVSKVHGTKPYLPDEFLRSKKFSTKVDTYSFGVVLFEIITGLRAYDENRSEKFLKDYVLKLKEEDNIKQAIDPRIGFEYFPFFANIFSVGVSCVSFRAKNRPTMMNVSRVLDEFNSQIGSIEFCTPTDYYIDPTLRLNSSSSAASPVAKPGHVGIPDFSYLPLVNNQRIPSPPNAIAAMPALQKVQEETIDEVAADGVAGRSQIPTQASDAQSDPAHASKSNPNNRECCESDRAEPVPDQPWEIINLEELPFISKLQH